MTGSPTRDELTAMSPDQVAKLDPSAVAAAITPPAPPPHTREALAAMAPEEVARLDPEIVRGLLAEPAETP